MFLNTTTVVFNLTELFVYTVYCVSNFSLFGQCYLDGLLFSHKPIKFLKCLQELIRKAKCIIFSMKRACLFSVCGKHD